MSIALPSASVTVQRGGFIITGNDVNNVCAYIGPSSKGALKTPYSFSTPEDASLQFGCGPLPRAAAYGGRSRATYLCVRIPAVAEAAVVSSITKPAGKTVSVTGTPLWGYDVIFIFTTGGTIGSPGAQFKYSLNGGVTYTDPAALSSDPVTTASVTGTTNMTGLGLYGGGGTLDGTTFDINVDGAGAVPVTFTAPTGSGDVLSAINTAVGASVATIDGSNHLKLTSATPGAAGSIVITAGSPDALAVLGLTADTYTGDDGGAEISLTGTGLTLVLKAADVYTTDDEIRFWVKPAAQLISPVTVTRADASTSVITATGTPEDEYDLVFEVLTGGTIGTDGIVFRYSLDGGETWSANINLGTASTYVLQDGADRVGYESTGVTLAFAAGTLDAGDKATAKTTGPVVQASDVQEALDILRASTHRWRFVQVPVDGTAAKASSMAGSIETLATNGVFTYLVTSARDRIDDAEIDATGQPSTDWAERLITEYTNVGSDRLVVSAGRARITCPITGRTNRRPASWIATARLVEKTIQVDPGRVRDGALSSDVRIFNALGGLVELDSNLRSALHQAQFLTLRRHERLTGVYITRGNAMAPAGSEYNRIAYRAVMDLASELYQAFMVSQLENYMFANPLTGPQPGQVQGQSAPVPGAIAEPDARMLDKELTDTLSAVLVRNGYVPSLIARVSRTDPFLQTGTLTANVWLDPLAYIDTFNGTISFTSPKFAALAA